MNWLRSTFRCGRMAAIGLLVTGLVGCSMFGGPAVPEPLLPERPVSLLHAPDPDDETPWFVRGSKGNIQALVALRKARHAVAKAAHSEMVAEYAATELAHAKRVLHKAEQAWQVIGPEPLEHKEQLFLAANMAHRAMRYAQIALAIGKREVSTQRLQSARELIRMDSGTSDETSNGAR